MNKELEKILKKFDIILENYELDKKCGQLSVESLCNLLPTEVSDLKQHIQDLQHQLEEKDKVIDEAIKYIKEKMTYYDDSEYYGYDCDCDGFELWEILERGKNGI